MIVDQAEQKGTGRWTSQDALDLGVPLTAITEAVFARTLSSLRDERRAASKALAGPTPGGQLQRPGLVDDIRSALYASKVVAYAQGFQQMAAASEAYDWDLNLGDDGDDLARRLHHPRPLPRTASARPTRPTRTS